MEVPDVLMDRYTFEFLFYLKDKPRMEIEFRGIRNNHYKNRETLSAMLDAGLITVEDDERIRGKVYVITDKGMDIIGKWKIICSAIVSR